MKLKFKALAAAATLALAGQASAALTSDPSNSPLFLTVWNINAPQQSYTRDLGITLDAFLANPTASFTSAGDSLFASTFSSLIATPSVLRWNIIGFDTVAFDANAARVVSTFSNLTTQQNANVQTIADAALFFGGALDTNGCDTAPSCASSGLGFTYGGDGSWGADYGGQANGANSTGTGFSSVAFYFLQGAAIANTELAGVTQFGNWALNAAGDAIYSAGVAAVPLPAAAWMLAAGLLGLGGAIRRRSAVAE